MEAGTKAQNAWVEHLKQDPEIGEPQVNSRTGVDTGRGGLSRFDVLFAAQNLDIFVEVQSSLSGSHKPVQVQGQIIGFAAQSAGGSSPARFYKIVADKRRVLRWSEDCAHKNLSTGTYRPDLILPF
jgi:hypothetical protein